MKNCIVYILLSYVGLNHIFSQSPVFQIDDLLNTITQQEEYKKLENLYNETRDIKPGFTFLEKVSLQTETDRFQLKRQEYLAKVYFNGAREINAVHKKYTILQQKEYQQLLKWKNERLSELYTKINKIIWYQNQLDVYHKLLFNIEQRIAYYQQQTSIKTINNIDDFLKTEDDRLAIEEKISYLQSEIKSSIYSIVDTKNSLKDLPRIDTANIITLTNINPHFTNCDYSQNPDWIIQGLDQQIQAQNLKIIKANQTQIFDFTQLKYSARKTNVLQREISVSMGITLPYKGSNNLQQSDAKIKLRDENSQTEILKNKFDKQCIALTNHVSEKIIEYNYQLASWQKTYQVLTSPELLKTSFVGPVQLLKLEELNLKHTLRLEEINYDAMSDYIEYLSLTGKLLSRTSGNYFIK